MDIIRLRQQVASGDQDAAGQLLILARRHASTEDWQRAMRGLGTLQAALHHGAFTLEHTVEVIEHALEALMHWHRRGDRHGRIHPGMLRLSRIDLHAQDQLCVTLMGSGEGSPPGHVGDMTPAQCAHLAPWMAPECWQPDIPLTPACDVYALGCVAFALLTGHPPSSGSPEEIARHHQRNAAPVLRLAPTPLGQHMQNWVLRALAPSLSRGRFRDAREALFALRRVDVPRQVLAPMVMTPARLHFRDPVTGQERMVTVLQGRTYLIGRWPECDIQITHRSVSRRHALLRFEHGSFVLGHVDSRPSVNGTFVNNQQKPDATWLPIFDADELRFGQVTTLFRTRYRQHRPTPISRTTDTHQRPPTHIPNATPRWPLLSFRDPITGETRHVQITARQPELTLGRNADCDVQIDHRSVSRRHLVIRWTEQGCVITDPPHLEREPVNSTFINGRRKSWGETVALNATSTLRLGQWLVTFTAGVGPGDREGLEKAWRDHVSSKTREVEVMRQAHEQLQLRERHLQQELDIAQRQLSEQQRVNAQLQARLQHLDMTHESLFEQVTRLKEQNRLRDQQLDDVRHALATRDERIEALQTRCQHAEDALHAKQQAMHATHDMTSDLKIALAQRDQALEALQRQHDLTACAHRTERDNVERLEALLCQLQRTLHDTEVERDTLRKLLDED